MAKYVQCPNCGFVGKAKKKHKGSVAAAAVLWILGLILLLIFWPLGLTLLACAFIYSVWRSSAKYYVCEKCHNDKSVRLKKKEYKIYQKTGSLPLPAHLKKCPHCAETIQADANVCKFCGRDIEPAAAPPPSNQA